MTTKEQTSATPAALSAQPGLMTALLDHVLGTINKTDEKAALQRVADLRERYPTATPDDLANRLIRQRCLQAGTVGAVTSGAAIVPGLGTAASLIFGVAADLRMTYQIQSELVLELAAVYNRPLGLDDKRYIVALVTGLSTGANQLVAKAGAEIAERASARLAQRAVAKTIPVLGVAASGGINLVSTYLIGRRAQAYFSQDPTLLAEWDDQMRAITGVDERELAGWLAETTERSWRLAKGQAQQLAGAVIVAGQSAGKIAVVATGQAGNFAGNIWQQVKARAASAGQAIRRRRRPSAAPPLVAADAASVAGEEI